MDRAAPLQNPEVDSKIGKEAKGIVVNEKAVRWEGSKCKDVGTCPEETELDAGAEHRLKEAIIPTGKRAQSLQPSAPRRRASAFC